MLLSTSTPRVTSLRMIYISRDKGEGGEVPVQQWERVKTLDMPLEFPLSRKVLLGTDLWSLKKGCMEGKEAKIKRNIVFDTMQFAGGHKTSQGD